MGTTDQPIAGEVKLLLPGGNNDESFLKKAVFFKAGRVQGHIYGGPIIVSKQGTRRLKTVKMAEEIDYPHDIGVPTPDFSVPDKQDMLNGLLEAVEALADGNDLYVGCKGGIGRTGTFMATLLKCAIMYTSRTSTMGHKHAGTSAINSVRAHFNPHACETKEQEDYVRNFDVGLVLKKLEVLNGNVTVTKKVATPPQPKPGYVDAILAFAKALVVFLPALILFLAFFKGKQK